MIGRLFNAPVNGSSDEVLGTSTIGSSEAIILATLAMKRKWQNARRAAGKSTEKPNLIMNSAVQVSPCQRAKDAAPDEGNFHHPVRRSAGKRRLDTSM